MNIFKRRVEDSVGIDESYKSIVDYINKLDLKSGDRLVSMSAYCDSVSNNFKTYNQGKYSVVYLYLINNGVNKNLYLTSDKISDYIAKVPYTLVFEYKSRYSEERGKLGDVSRTYYDRLVSELKESKHDIKVEGLTIYVR